MNLLVNNCLISWIIVVEEDVANNDVGDQLSQCNLFSEEECVHIFDSVTEGTCKLWAEGWNHRGASSRQWKDSLVCGRDVSHDGPSYILCAAIMILEL